MMVIPLAAAGARLTLGEGSLPVTARWLAFLPWYLVLSAVSAWMLYSVVEKPVLAWRNRVLASRREARVAAAVAVPPTESAALGS